MMDALDAIMTRRSIRSYTDEAVTDEEIRTVLRAAMAAPSASNERPWRFVVVRDPRTIARLAKATPFAKVVARAHAVIVVCGDKKAAKYPGFWVIDCSAAIQNALLAAHAIGLGGVWIGVHPVLPFVAAVRATIGAPRHVVPHSMIALGHPAEGRPAVDRYDEAFVHDERW